MNSFPLTLAQQDIYFDQLHAPDSPRYNIGGYIRFDSVGFDSADVQRLQDAHARMVGGHDAFGLRIDGASQFITAERTSALPVLEFLSTEDADQWLRDEFRKRFAIEKAELFRAYLLNIASGTELRYVVVAHHLMIDGWGFSNLARILCTEYGEDGVSWQERAADDAAYATSARYSESSRYWSEHCTPLPEAALTPFHRTRFPGVVPSGRETLMLSREDYNAHVAKAAEMGVGIAAYFMANIARLSGRDRLILGVPSHNRRTHAQKKQIGVYIGINPLAIDVKEEDTLATLAARIQQTQKKNYRHARYPFGHTMRDLGVVGQRLYDIGFNYLQMQNEVEIHYLSHGHEPAPLSITLYENGATLPVEVQFDYRLDYFDAAEAKLLVQRFSHLLETGEVLSPRDREIAANAPDVAFPDARIEELFEQHAARTPDAIALVSKSGTLTYRELNERANELAKQLPARELVAVSVDRSMEAIVGTLAILKAGAAYLPLDPNYPESRRRYLLEDSGARFMITKNGVERLDGAATQALEDTNVAYVMYTSGSTGQPKGVMVEHRGVVRLVVNNNYAPLGAQTRMLQVSSYGFDAATFEIWGALLNGGTLVLYPESHLDLQVLNEQIDAHGIDTILLTAALFEQWSHQLPKHGTLRHVLSGGDVVSPGAVARVYDAMPDVTVVNAYGPTENSVMACCFVVPRDADFTRAIPLGRKVNGTSLHVLDNNLKPLPAGAVGELLVGGPGVARGYWNRPELTAEKFISVNGERLYRTGDLVRYLPDGNLTFIGRADQQVKVRGFRIEPGEIEAALLRVEGIAEAAVVVRGEGADKSLAAYYAGDIDPREELARLLPAHMIPSAFVRMDALPLNASGKVDRKVLPDVDMQSQHELVAPVTAAEVCIANVWRDVLKLDQVSVTASFFESGGHSLLATRVAADLSQKTGRRVTVRDIFEHNTVRSLAGWLDGQPADGDVSIPRVSREEALALSFAQQRLWFIDQLEGSSAQYNIPFALRLSGDLRVDALQHAFDEIVRRHEVIRTTYGEDVQIIHEATPLAIERIALRDESEIETLIREEAAKPFDLTADRMLRVKLVALSATEHVLLVTVHHIAADGWSIGVLVKELVALYGGEQLQPLPTQYADFAAWHRGRMQGAALETQLAYWKSQLAGAPAVHGLPLDRPRPAQQQFAGRTLQTHLDADVVKALSELAVRHDATLFMVLQTAFSLLVSRWSGTPDVVIGTPVAGRTHKDVESLIGFFVNTLVLRTEVADDAPFTELLRTNRDRAVDAFSHQDVPFEMLVDALRPERSLSHTPLFQILFALQNTERFSLELPGLTIARESCDYDLAKFDLMLSASESEDGLNCAWTYATSLFDAQTIERLAASFAVLTRAIAAAPETASARLPILTPAEELAIVAREGLSRDYDYRTIHELFEEQVALDPDATALVFEGQSLTYNELNARANQLAHYLRDRGVDREVLVGVSIERSFEMLVSLLGILKAGGAYVPLDPGYPQDRLDYMREDSGVGIVIKAELLAAEATTIDTYSRENVGPTSGLDDLAYMIYTSGSTGKPKGALNEHRAVVNRLLWMRERYALHRGARFLQKTPFSFDVSVWELFNGLISGATLVIARPEGHRDGDYLAQLIAGERITIVHFVPSMLSAFLRTPNLDRITTVERVFCSGEALPPELVQEFFTHFDCELHNLYGPTEAAIEVTHWECRPEHDDVITPLGHAVANTRMYVLDRHLRPLPDGVTGELYIGGVQVARGYHGRPELTAERFLASPHRAGERMYRTGDLARYRTDGILEFLGRIDDQVKIRGFRIELGEIKAQLLEQPRVREALVIAKGEGSDKRLVAYIVPHAIDETIVDDLKDALRQQLPDYMVPQSFVLMDAFPVNANGKIDRKALPEPGRVAVEFVAPVNATEERVAEIWREILKLDAPVSVTANFFDLGGHSLLATRIVSAVREAFDKAIPVRALFEHNTVRALSNYLEQQGVTAYRAIPVVPREGALPLSFAQQRLWFIDQLEEGSAQYNMPAALRLRGALDRDALQQTFDTLVARHEVLRTTFVDGAQVIHPATKVNIRTIATSDEQLETLAREEALTPFDLRHDPMLRVTLLPLGEDDHALLITVHHIAADGWSVEVMVREIGTLYGAFTRGEEHPLAPLPIQYADYAAWHRDQLQGPVYEQQLSYWKTQLAGLPQVHTLPLDKPRPAQFDFKGDSFVRELEPALVQQLHTLAQSHNASLFMLLQSAFALLVARWSRGEDVVIGTPIAGREHRALDPLIGFFVNTLVLRTRIDSTQTFADFLANAKQTALDAYANQTVPFETLVDELKPERSLSHGALFQIMFSLAQRQPETLELAGLDVTTLRADNTLTRFDLSLTAVEGDAPRLHWEYATSLFDRATIERMAASFEVMLRAIAAAPQTRVDALPLLTAEESAALLAAGRGEVVPVTDLLVHEIFEQHAALTPYAIALKTDAGQWTYRELNERANRLAHALIAQGVGPETLVGIATGRSAEMIVSLLAVLKAGGGYVPLDAKYPASRIQQMIEDSGVTMVLDQDDVARLSANQPAMNPAVAMTDANVAYVIYTSGSTGLPKGVVVEHAQLRSHAAAIQARCRRTGEQRVLSVTSFSFDVFVEELSLSLLSGGTMVLVTDGLSVSAQQFWSLLATERITALSLTTAWFHYVVAELTAEEAGAVRDMLQLVFVGGEALLREPVAQWQQLIGTSAGVFNAYGPTECTIIATVFDLRDCADERQPPIGRALPNYSAHVLDAAGAICPIGAPGELHLGGNSVARGYLNRAGLTAEKFVTLHGERLYRTGDLVRRNEDGHLSFLGRTDDQVKIRGFRIELGEVEAALLRAPGIDEAVVIARGEGSGKRLVAYLVSADAGAGADTVREMLERALPAHMVPSAFVTLAALPLNANGKIDRKALPEPERVAIEYVAPSNATEKRIAALWQEILKLDVPVSVTANFFDLGGHSLLATRIVSAIAEAFDKAIPVRALFEHNTVRSLTSYLEQQGLTAYRLIPVVPRDGALPLSFAQQRLWFIDQLEEGSAQYNMPAALRIKGALDRDALQRTFDTIVERHEVLRTTFAGGTQVIHPATPVNIRTIPTAAAQLETLARVEALTPFDLRHDPMLRVTLLALGEDDHALLVTLHHIAADGWSVEVMIGEIGALYGACSRGEQNPLAPLPIQYADYASWHRGQLQGPAYEQQLAYWKTQLAGLPQVHSLPLDKPRPAQFSVEGDSVVRPLDPALMQQLQTLAQAHNASLFMLLQSAFALLVARWSRAGDVVVGTPIAGREHRDLDPLIGFFVNTLVLRTRIDGAQTFTELIANARQTALDAYAHQTVPFEMLVDELKPERSLSHGALFQIMFSLAQGQPETLALPGLDVTTLHGDSTLTKFDLGLTAVDGDAPRLQWEYATSLFERATIERLASSFEVLLRAIVTAPQTRVDTLPLLAAEESAALVEAGRGEVVPVPEPLVHQLFEQNADRTPDAIALHTDAGQWTYRQLDARANQLAHALVAQGVGPDVLVGIATERTAEMVISLLAVLKAGGGYVPLDAKYPQSRIDQMIEDSGAKLVLRQADVARLSANQPVTRPVVQSSSSNTAYVIYTSGSTGRPKGVVIEHRAVQGFAASMNARFGGIRNHRVLSVSSFSFDVFVEELVFSILSGGTMVLVTDGLSVSAKQFWSMVIDQRITFLGLSTAYFHYLCSELTADVAARVKETLRLVFAGGEALLREPVAQWHRLIGREFPLFNVYGPTECTIICTAFDMAGYAGGDRLPPIGTSLPNYTTHVLDAAGAVCPVDMPGELHIGGGSVARGYLHRPELTAEKFVTLHGERLYKTGDLVRRGADGNIAFLGRTDDQVKIRGFRIELGEVEAALLRAPGIDEAVVVAKGEGNDKRLLAYVVGAGAEHLRETLDRTLPAHMVPSAFVTMDVLPLNANGKIDKKALPEPERIVVEYVAPATATESRVAELWQQILKLEAPVSVTANFFDLGGHSLLATRIASAIGEALQKTMPVRAIFEHNTVRSLSAYLDARTETVHRAIPVVPRSEALPLSFAQQRLWFIDQLEGSSAQYNMPAALRLRGTLDRDALQKTFDAIVERHEILRTRYTGDVQDTRTFESLPIRELDVTPEQLDALLAEEAGRPFELSRDLMLRVALLRLSGEEHVLVCTMHHIASDAWSLDILIGEVRALYSAFVAGEPNPLAPLPIQYADFAHWQRAQSEGNAKQIEYWKTQLAGLPRMHSLPLDKTRPAQQRFEGGKVERTIDARLVDKLNALAHGRNASLFMLMESAFALLVARWSRSNDVAIGTPIAGREHKSLDPLIGFFVNTLVLRTRLDETQTFEQLLEQGRQTALDAFANQSIPFETLVDELKPERSLSHGALFQILFSLLRSSDNALELPGLEVTPLARELGLTKFDLNLTAIESDGRVHLHWQYATSLFERDTIERMADSFAVLLDAIAEAPATNVYALPLVAETPALRGAITSEGRERCVHAVFEEQAAKTPDALAAGALTYRELNECANRVAHALLAKPRGARIGIYAERSADVLVGMLGVLKAGLTYVPFEPGNTPERLRHMIENGEIACVIAQPHLAQNLPAGVEVLPFDVEGATHNPNVAVSLEQSAYVMYTSGSTGVPKGVEITHGGLVDYLAFASRHYYAAQLGGSFVVTSHGFDITIPSLYVPLMHGGRVQLATPGEELTDLATILANDSAAFLLRMTPMHLTGVLPLLGGQYESAHVFVIGGEGFPASLARELQSRFPNAQIFNHYGPTETVVGCAMYDVTGNLATAGERLPIGRAMENTELFVLNEALLPNPVGVPGELHIGGAGVARGYVNQPGLTAQKFVDYNGTRVYKSGDLVRLLPGGDLEFLGRVDHQVKIRGFRIEPGEIESVLKTVAKDALVTTQGEGEHKQLVAYVVGDVTIDDMKARLRAALPEYMVPTGWCLLDAFPLNANGKIDRKALPAVDRQAVAFVAPATITETKLAEIWQHILKLDTTPSVTANFFELGGHSLLATRVASAVSAELDKSMPVRTLFEHGTIRALAAHLDTVAATEHRVIELVPRDGDLPLSFAQQRLWFVDQLTGASAQYNMPAAFRLRGRLDCDALQHALDEIVRRHEVLRTNYVSELGQARQVVRDAARVPIARLDVTEETLQELAHAEAQKPFDLASDLMVRVALLTIADDEHVLLFTMHHIASDGWSTALLAREFTMLYRGDTLPELPVQYADFAAWQRNWLTGDVLDAQLGYWKNQLAGAPPVHSLPLDRPRPTLQGSAGDRYVQDLDRGLHAGLNALARKQNASLYMVLQSALALLVGRWSNETDVVIGNTIAGRTHKDVEELIGFFVNNVVLRTDLSAATSFEDLVANVKQTSLDAHANQDVPFEMLVEALKIERSLSHAPLVQIVFTFRNNERAEVRLPGLTVEGLGDSLGSSRFDLELLVTEHAGRLELAWGYSTDIFERDTIERLGESFEVLLRNAVAAPRTHIEQLGIVSDADRARRAALQPADLPFPEDLCVHELFEQRAAETPDAVAVVFEDDELTYGELNAAANRLARYLVDKKVQPDARVALCAERSFDMVVGMLAILKAGAGYVPIDPQYPEERIEQILTDSGVSMILTQAELLELNPMFNDYAALPIDGGFRDVLLARYSTEDLGRTATPRNLAYVIYTSGSTGTPKGAMVEHRNVVRLVVNNHYVPLSAETRILQASTSAFDAATFEIWGALLNGGQLILYPESRVDLSAINRQIEQHAVNTFFVTTGLFDQWSYQLPKRDCLRWILTGGDVTSPASVQRVYDALPSVHVSNIYGPTENTTFSTYFPIDRHADFSQSLPIGNKINGTSLHVLDRAQQPLPAGAIGELYCGGPGVARGYLNQPALTDEKFVTIEGERLYRTGDLVRMLPDGNVAFIGRADNQVKIRGFRIELGEIEAKLLRVPGVRDVFVVARGDRTNKYLAAYLVPEETWADAEENDWREHLRTALKQTLPEHMIPTAFVRMTVLPLNANGKVDQKGLPEPERLAQVTYVAPSTDAEIVIAAIWADILKLDGNVSANADFFDLGGNSLTLLRVKAHVESAFALEVPTRFFFEYPTVTGIALATDLLRAKTSTAALAEEEMEVGEL